VCVDIDFKNVIRSNKPNYSFEKEYLKPLDKHYADDHGWVCPYKKTHTGNGTYTGKFAFSLTYSPTDELTEEDLVKAARKICSQKSNPVKSFAWYLEYRDPETKGGPHIHGMYETESGGRIETKHWKRAWPIWDQNVPLGAGFRGGYHRPVRSDEGYANYISKDNGPHDYCVPDVA